MADLSRSITFCSDALQAEKASKGQMVSPARGADGQPLATKMAARALQQQEAAPQQLQAAPQQQEAAPQQQEATSQQLLQQFSKLQEQLTRLQQQPAAPEQPSLSATAIKEEIIAAVSAATQQPAEDPKAQQMQLSSGKDQPPTLADKVLAASVAQAKAEAKVQPLLYLRCPYHTYLHTMPLSNLSHLVSPLSPTSLLTTNHVAVGNHGET